MTSPVLSMTRTMAIKKETRLFRRNMMTLVLPLESVATRIPGKRDEIPEDVEENQLAHGAFLHTKSEASRGKSRVAKSNSPDHAIG